MDQRVFHGKMKPEDFGKALVAQFNRGNLRAQQVKSGDKVIVQIATRRDLRVGGDTALSVLLQKAPDGVIIRIGKQSWWGLAASMGTTALAALRNPFHLIGRLDDIAQDIENINLAEKVWTAIEEVARASGASFELSERLRRVVCEYCRAANPVGESSCVACGAPLGDSQPRTCPHCGFVIHQSEHRCPNCGKPVK